MRAIWQGFSIYADRRMPRIFLLGLMQGFPWILIGAALSLWLREEGLSRSDIGLFGLVFSVYSINFLWAPLLDRIRLPFLSRRFGQRRAWILLMQVIIIAAMAGLFVADPQQSLYWIALMALTISVSSATQDIALDALRIDLIRENEADRMTAAAALMVAGWWTAFKLGGAVALYLAAFYQNAGIANYWQLVYVSLILPLLVFNGILLWGKSDTTADHKRRLDQASYDSSHARLLENAGIGWKFLQRILVWLLGTLVSPLWSFFRRNGVGIAFALLAFIMLFKIGEAFLGRMSIIFYADIGFSKEEIAKYSKIIGWVATIVFSLLGGVINARLGLITAVFVSGFAMAATNLLFSLMALVGPDAWLFVIAVIADDFTSAVSTVTFVAFISQLCDKTFSATQYALMASLGTFARNTLASFSGFMTDGLERWTVAGDLTIFGASPENTAWAIFFVMTTLMVLPGLGLLWLISARLKGVFERAMFSNQKDFTKESIS